MKTKKIIICVSVVLATGMGYYIVKAASSNILGFSWIGNNLQEGVEQGDPVIGMISMKGNQYGVTLQGEGNQIPLIGSAWIGIGIQDDKFNDFTSQNDLPSLGWIHFNQPFDQTKLDELTSANCMGAGDCHGARWNRKSGLSADTGGFEGYLSGWARMEIGPNADTTPYPDVWVHFKSPSDPANYTCNENDHSYYVCIDPNGKMEGYAWSAGRDATSIDGNPGLGWIKFSKQFVGLESPGESPKGSSNQGVVASQSQFCATLLDSNSPPVGCINSGDFTGDFKFKAYQSGITLNSVDKNKNFQWTCSDNEPPLVGEQVTCSYKNAGTYTPKLKIYDEASQRWVNCASQTSVKVTTETNCSVLVKNTSGSDKDDFSKSVSATLGDALEAKITRQCLDGGEVKWNIVGSSELSTKGDTVNFKPNAGVKNSRVSATITKDGKTYNCSPADISVSEKIRWR